MRKFYKKTICFVTFLIRTFQFYSFRCLCFTYVNRCESMVCIECGVYFRSRMFTVEWINVSVFGWSSRERIFRCQYNYFLQIEFRTDDLSFASKYLKFVLIRVVRKKIFSCHCGDFSCSFNLEVMEVTSIVIERRPEFRIPNKFKIFYYFPILLCSILLIFFGYSIFRSSNLCTANQCSFTVSNSSLNPSKIKNSSVQTIEPNLNSTIDIVPPTTRFTILTTEQPTEVVSTTEGFGDTWNEI